MNKGLLFDTSHQEQVLVCDEWRLPDIKKIAVSLNARVTRHATRATAAVSPDLRRANEVRLRVEQAN